ncbi:MAG: hypothetical protein ACJAVO_001454 [Parvibaculaceae bacterium]|jgi:uncharacterized protein YqeY|nr:GatB/YqeY domain-containing protein [Parvibaculaceae bacterium]|tara:strand:+ start:402 stop:854 length:453 start_codon:yes stop_codon:yes gene_type:complete
MRDQIIAALKEAMKNKDKVRLSALRLMQATLKDRDIAARGEGKDGGISDEEALQVLAKMVKQRQESAEMYDQAGRVELADKERQEIAVIQDFMPKQLSQEEAEQIVAKLVADLEAGSLKDMGRVMGELKKNYAGQMDFGKVGGFLKSLLS